MKNITCLALLILAGCQSAPAVSPAASSPSVTPEPIPVTPSGPPVPGQLERKVRQQAQYIDALLSQNSALVAKLAATPSPPAAVAVTPPVPIAPLVVAQLATSPIAAEESALSPNADGIIDLAAATTSGELVNPFVVRGGAGEGTREILLHVSGIIAGPRACAVINERLAQAGDTVESFTVERIDPDAVTLRHGAGRLRLPLAEKPVRVRMKP